MRSAGRFIAKNPTTMLSMARHALGMRIAVPLDSLRWFIANTPPSQKAPQDVTITPRPPAIGIGATVDLMGTTVRALVRWAVVQWKLFTIRMETTMLTKKGLIIGTTTVAIVAIAGILVVGYPPSGGEIGTIGGGGDTIRGVQQAGRYRGRTMSQKDVSEHSP